MPEILVEEIIKQILNAIAKIERRFFNIRSSNDFILTDSGSDSLDSICMMLIAIGESCKQIDKLTDSKLLQKYSEIDWKGIKGIRDVISHQYFDIDEEIVYSVCKNHIPTLKIVLTKILSELRKL